MSLVMWIILTVVALGSFSAIFLWQKKSAEKKKNEQKKKRKEIRDQRKKQEQERLAKQPPKVIVAPENLSEQAPLPPGTSPLRQTPSKIQRGRMSVILLVEDSPTVMTTLRKILERWGYKVITASDGRKAWAELQKQKPDLVVSDIDMPELSGIELLKLMRSDLVLMSVPVILITASPYHYLQASQEVGVNGLLAKPFEDKALLNQVRYLLQE